MSKNIFRSFYRELRKEQSVTIQEASELYQSFFSSLDKQVSETHVFDQVRWNDVLVQKVKSEIQEAIHKVISNIPFLKNKEIAPIIRYNIEEHIKATSKNINLLTQPYYDPLTGALTRSFLREWRNLEKTEYTVILLDLDNFKILNDTHWHQAWDKHLQKAAEFFSSVVRYGQDYLIRTGWDEFILLIDSFDRSVIERITMALHNSWPWELIFSDGIAFSDESHTLEEVIALADTRMYQMKEKLKQTYEWKNGQLEQIA